MKTIHSMTVSVKEGEELPQRDMLKEEEIHLFIHSFIHSFFEKITGPGEYIERETLDIQEKELEGERIPKSHVKGLLK